MLNDADGHGAGKADEAVKDADALFRRLKRDVNTDYNSKGQVNWRREAREDLDMKPAFGASTKAVIGKKLFV